MKTKYLFFLSAYIFMSVCSHAQNLEAIYKVTQPVTINDGGKSRTIAVLDYTGYFYQKGNRYISFLKPLYLDKYPDGGIEYEISANSGGFFGVFMDTLHKIGYKDMDSLIYRDRFEVSGKSEEGYNGQNCVRYFEPGFQDWKLLPDTKEINGLKCQKARLTGTDTTQLQWEVWFCQDIPVAVGIENIFDLPGLIVEAKNFVSNESHVLTAYSTSQVVPDNVFWPKYFDAPFTTMPTLTKIIPNQKPDKLQRKIDINKQ